MVHEIKEKKSLTNEVEGMMETVDSIVKYAINMIPLSEMTDTDDDTAVLIKDYFLLLNQTKTISLLTAQKIDKIEEQNECILDLLKEQEENNTRRYEEIIKCLVTEKTSK